MRVITGTARGLRLKSVPGLETRPTADKVKEGLFSAVQFDLEGRRVLDLFAGTGQLGIEALSRGAESAVFVDSSPAALSVIEENLAHTHLSDRAVALRMDYKAYLKSAPRRRFNIVFLDPPYRQGYIARIISFIETFDILAENGIIICESATDDPLPDSDGYLEKTRDYRYGQTAVTVYRKRGADNAQSADTGEL